MSNQLDNKARTLAQMLAANRLTKMASDQEIEHKTPTDQTDLGKEQTQEIKDNIDGTLAFTSAAANKDSDTVDTPPNCQNLNKDPQAALSSTGTGVAVMNQDGTAAQLKTAADYRHELARVLGQMNKQAAYNKQRAEAAANFRTGTEVMQKFASLTPQSTQEQINDAADDLMKLAAYNPMFTVCRDRILMNKLAEDVAALAEAEGISPDDAAAALDVAAEQNPEMMQEAEDEANGEAVAELADAEDETNALMQGVSELAANASAATGQNVTEDDILNAIDEVSAQAEELGVPPEALIQQAMQDMQIEADVTPEDEANAQAILEEAAANGISPEEVIAMAAEELDGTGASSECDPSGNDACCADGSCQEKTASVNMASTSRAAYTQYLMHNAK